MPLVRLMATERQQDFKMRFKLKSYLFSYSILISTYLSIIKGRVCSAHLRAAAWKVEAVYTLRLLLGLLRCMMCVCARVSKNARVSRISSNQLMSGLSLFRKHHPIKRNTAKTFNWTFFIEHHQLWGLSKKNTAVEVNSAIRF